MTALKLTDGERQVLQAVVRKHSTSQQAAMRAKIVLLAADGASNKEIAAKLGVSLPTVRLWLSRFGEQRLDGLADKRRRGRPRTITSDQVRLVLAALQGPSPDGSRSWSLRLLSVATHVPSSTVHRILRANGLRPPDWSPSGRCWPGPPVER